MNKSSKIESLGTFLFRWRSFSVVGYLPFLYLLSGNYEIPFRSSVSATVYTGSSIFFVFLGGIMRLGITGFAAHGNSGRNLRRQRADSLHTCEFYSIVRNPLYVANFMIVTGIMLLFQSPWIIAFHVVFFILFYFPVIKSEEGYLKEKFPYKFAEYQRRTPRFVPNPFLWKAADRRWNWKRAIRREQDTLFSSLLCFSIINYLLISISESEFNMNILLFSIVAAGFVVWILLKYIKKSTGLLKG